MNLLVDTHIVLWWLAGDDRLSNHAREVIAAPQNTLFVSAASVWELRIKEAIGKLVLPTDFSDVLADEPFDPLPVSIVHAHAVAALPLHHRDPFDRILIAQAQVEGFKILTHDAAFKRYEVEHLIV